MEIDKLSGIHVETQGSTMAEKNLKEKEINKNTYSIRFEDILKLP